MKKNFNIFVCSSLLWTEETRVGSHFIADFFLDKGASIFWLTIRFSPFSFIKKANIKSNIKKLHLSFKNGKEYRVKNGRVVNAVALTPFQPVKIPVLTTAFVAKNYLKFFYPTIKRLLNKYNFNSIDIFICDPSGVDYFSCLNQINPKTIIYRINDRTYGVEPKGRVEIERQILKKANIVVAVNKPLYDYAVKVRGEQKGIYFLPNGVDIKAFSKIYSLPEEYKNIPKPRAVYIGNTNLIDWELLVKTALIQKQVSFIVIGPGKVLKNLPENIYILGSIPYNKIPAYFQYADIGLILFKNIPYTSIVERPLKFYQYLASGLPVVTTSYGGLKKMSPQAILADSPQTFSKGIQKGLKYTAKEKESLVKFVNQFSWENIYKKFNKILKGTVPTK